MTATPPADESRLARAPDASAPAATAAGPTHEASAATAETDASVVARWATAATAPGTRLDLPWRGAALFLAGAAVASLAWFAAERIRPGQAADDSPSADAAAHVPAVSAGAARAPIDAVLASTDTFTRDSAAQALAARNSAAGIEALLRALGGRTGPSADALRATLLTRLAGIDPPRALAAIADLQPQLAGRTAELIALVFDSWGRRDMPAAVADWRLLEGVDRELAADALLLVVLERGGDAEGFLRALPPPVPLQRLRATLARESALTDPPGAWQRALRQRDLEALRTVARTWTRADPAAALDAAARVGSSALRDELRALVLTTWLRRDPITALDAAFAATDAGTAPGADMLAAIAYTAGSALGPAGFDELIEHFPAARRDEALEPLLQGAMAQDPEGTWQLTRRVPLDDAVRARLRGSILRQVAATSAAQAITLANALSDTRERDALMQMLSEDYIAHDSTTALQFIMEIDDLPVRAALRDALATRTTPGASADAAGTGSTAP